MKKQIFHQKFGGSFKTWHFAGFDMHQFYFYLQLSAAYHFCRHFKAKQYKCRLINSKLALSFVCCLKNDD